MSRRLVAALAALVTFALVVVVTGGSLRTSSATYTSTSRTTATVRAAADWTPPTVELRQPAAAAFGTVTLTADAADQETGVAGVAVQQRPAGTGAWSTVCTATPPAAPSTASSAPTSAASPATGPGAAAAVSCTWDTTTAADGPVDLRAVATDRTGLSTTSATVRTTVANAVTVTLRDPGDSVRGTVPLAATLAGPAAVSGWSVRFEYAVADSSSWRTICTDTTAPYTCGWVTTALAAQEYDLRAVAVSASTTRVSPLVTDVLVDNTAPTVSLVDPGSPLRGTVTFTARADDEDSGVDQVVIQHARGGSSAYADICTLTDEPFSCSYRTGQLPDGTYSFRAVAIDQAGNTTTSAAVPRVVDNTVSSVSVDDPGAHLRGRVTVAASASSTAGVASVRLQRATAASSTWADLCTDTTDPYSCSWDTAAVADGAYDLRAIMVDGAGRTTVSATLAARQVDNSPVRGVDVQTSNGSGTPGRLDTGDTVTLTYNQRIDPASVLSGWAGDPVPVTVRLRDGYLAGSTSNGDVLDIQRNGATLPLGAVALRQNYVGLFRTATFAATMTTVPVTVDGAPATAVTMTVGARVGGQTRRVARPSTMVWTPSGHVSDLTGRRTSGAPVTETGAWDREF